MASEHPFGHSRGLTLRIAQAAACVAIVVLAPRAAAIVGDSIENSKIKVVYNLDSGTYSIKDKRDNLTGITGAVTRIGTVVSTSAGYTHTSQKTAVSDTLGQGQKLTVTSRKSGSITLVLEIILYQGASYAVLNAGLENVTGGSVRIKYLSPLTGATAFAGNSFTGYKALDGYSGGSLGNVYPGHGHTSSVTTGNVSCENNALATFGTTPATKRSLVIGGLTYHEFAKKAEIKKLTGGLSIAVWSYDSVGKLIDAGVTYLPDEKYYVDFTTDNQFESLEQYAAVERKAQRINLPMYDFPTLCLWYAGKNTTAGGVAEMNSAVSRGLTKYTRVGIRIVPDNYDANNENGWWDDAHFRQYGHYVVPYETSKKFGDAIKALGGVPINYFQSTKSSDDFCVAHPTWLLFNNPNLRTGTGGGAIDGFNKIGAGVYDLTDPGMLQHMKNVYKNQYDGGFAGVMIDYPHLSWHETGGFDDLYTTTAGFHRLYFKLAWDGLGGPLSYVDERMRDSDVSLGVVASKRTECDTWEFDATQARNAGLRWYKNRVVVNWDMDAKAEDRARPANIDGVRSMYTMSYVVSGRLLLGRAISLMSDSGLYALERVCPFHAAPQTARPIDAFDRSDYPRIYDFAVNPDWHQTAFFNGDVGASAAISVSLSGNTAFGGLGLDAGSEYYVYDFWNRSFIGTVKGTASLTQTLRPGETRMMSIRKKTNLPQVLSTNRHIMQGYVDMVKTGWDGASSSRTGTSKIIGGEPYKVIIALNGATATDAKASAGATATVSTAGQPAGLAELTIVSPANADIDWTVNFSGATNVASRMPMKSDGVSVRRAGNRLAVEFDGNLAPGATIKLLSLSGRTTSSVAIAEKSGPVFLEFPCGAIPRGLCILTITANGRTLTRTAFLNP